MTDKNQGYALVTGASSGIGRAMAILLAKEGKALIITARSSAKLESLHQQIGTFCAVPVIKVVADLSSPEGVRHLIESISKQACQVDVLINNAGFGDYGLFASADREKTLQMIDLNVRTLTELTHHFLPAMLNQKAGHILNVASVASFVPGPLMSVYYATKHYVLAFSEGLARELKGSGVQVTALCPGPTESGFQDAAQLSDSELFKGRKLPTSEEVAKYGLEAMYRGKVVATHGLSNKIGAFLPRLLPRSTVRNIIYRMQRVRH
jgi:short-subunit dehydrogenase